MASKAKKTKKPAKKHVLTLNIADKALKKFTKEVESLAGCTVTNPLLLLQKLLQQECDCPDMYAEHVFDGGGNSLGDVFKKDSDFADCAVENDD